MGLREFPRSGWGKLTLADPPYGRHNQGASAVPNLGILYLASALREAYPGILIQYVEGYHSRDEHLRLVKTFGAPVYGISFSSPFAGASLELIREVKAQCPAPFVICGGAHVTAEPVKMLFQSQADVCCIGEGEETLIDLLRVVQTTRDFREVTGIAFKNAGGDIIVTPPRQYARDLDTLPLPAWDLVDLRNYSGSSRGKGGPSASLVASRAWPFPCTFSSNPVWKLQTRGHRKRSPASIAHEAEFLYGLGCREIYIRSDELNADLGWALEVLEALRQLKHPDLFFRCNLRAWPMTEELASALRRAGCWLCHIDLESASERVLRAMGKEVRLEQISHGFKMLKNQGIRTFTSMTLYQTWDSEDGLGVETTREALQTLRRVLQLHRKGLLDLASWGFATPYPGTALFQTCKKYNLFRSKRAWRAPLSVHEISTRLPGISKLEMMLVRQLGFLVQAYLACRAFRAQRDTSVMTHPLGKPSYWGRPW